MTGKITQNGCLEIERQGAWRKQLCPHAPLSNLLCCGDWCPLFQDSQPTSEGTSLRLCSGEVLRFEKFDDERLLDF